MEKRRKQTRRAAVQKKGTRTGATHARTLASFFFVPEIDHTIRLLTRSVLQDIPCATCGRHIHTLTSVAAPVSPVLIPLLSIARQEEQEATPVRPLTPAAVPRVFDPAPYLLALRAQPADAARKTLVSLTAVPAPSSTHLLSLREEETAAPSGRARRRAPLFRPAELPEMRHFVERQGAEFSMPALEERVRLHRAVPGGVVGVGKEVVAGTLSTMDGVSAPMRAVIGALPAHMGFGAHVEDVIPVPSKAVVPKTVAWASGVPKNLPVVDWTLTPPPAPPTVAVFPVIASEEVVEIADAEVGELLSPVIRRETVIERLERIPEQILDVLRSPSRPWRSAGAFALLLAMVILTPLGAVSLAAKGEGVKAAILSSSKEGVAALVAAGHTAAARDVAGTASSFSTASASFGEARATLDQSVGGLRSLAAALPGVGQTVQAVDRLLAAADALSLAGAHLAPALAPQNQNPLIVLSALVTAVADVQPDLVAADTSLAALDPETVPKEVREQLLTLKDGLHLARQTLDGFPEKADALATILGRDSRKRYLVVFQNASELRPTGGFIGSIAEVTVDKGLITDIRVPKGGVYDQQGSLRAQLLPPTPMRQITARWEMQDANWFPDFPTSAEKLAWFYQKGGGPSVDGVIAITSDVLPALLALTGPISMPTYHRTMTAENVIRETQQIVETDYDREANTPKQFIGDLLEAVLERLRALPAQKVVAAGDLFAGMLQDKTLQMHFFDEHVERVAAQSGWNGALAADGGDALMVVDTNIGGGKTDSVIQKTGTVATAIAEDGTVTHTLTLHYTHNGIPSDPFSGKRYQDYLRLYVAPGSTLLQATGDFGDTPITPAAGEGLMQDPLLAASFESASFAANETATWAENGRTVFGRWLSLPAGGEATVQFVYTSGVRLASRTSASVATLIGGDVLSYRFLVERQPGSQLSLSAALTAPGAWEAVWRSPDAVADTGTPSFLNRDRLYAVVFR
ncbi:DUF4012 domain-containing protein [Patescibacteria group bacterium]|nr:DUF4012 domain-containing protein [Patescibacteria group bacterium]